MDYEAVVLAAGFSSRMGEWKPGIRIGKFTIIEAAVEPARSVCSRVIVVGGEKTPELRKIFSGRRDVSVVENSEPEKGMLSSVQTGIREIKAEHFFLCLGDMPFIAEDTYRSIREAAEGKGTAYHGDGPHPVFIPRIGSVDRKTGHPILLHRKHIGIIDRFDSERFSMRDVLKRIEPCYVEVTDDGILNDLDTPEDFEAFVRKRGKNTLA